VIWIEKSAISGIFKDMTGSFSSYLSFCAARSVGAAARLSAALLLLRR